MMGLVGAEMLKIRTTRSFWWTLVIGFALVVLFTVVGLSQGVDYKSDVEDTLSNTGIIGLLMIILGVVGSAGEYRHGTITSSLLAVPNRARFLVSKAIAYFLYGALATALSMVVVIALLVIWLNGDGTSISGLGVDGTELTSIIFGSIAYGAIGASFGVVLGALLRNQVAAIVGVLILLLVIDPLLGELLDTYAKFGLSGIGTSLDASTGDAGNFEPLARGVAAALFLGYVAVLIAICSVLDSRRDVSS